MSISNASQPHYANIAKKHGIEQLAGDRGAPENTSLDFKASQYVLKRWTVITANFLALWFVQTQSLAGRAFSVQLVKWSMAGLKKSAGAKVKF